MGTGIVRSLKRAAAVARKSAPYLLLEILLPGGTLFALLLFIYQQRHLLATEKPRALHVVVAEAPVLRRGRPVAVVACRCSPAPAAACCTTAANDNDAAVRRAA